MMRGLSRIISVIIIVLPLFHSIRAISQPRTPCRDCPLPGARSARDTVMDVSFYNHTVMHNVLSAKRTTRPLFGRWEQSVIIQSLRGSNCADTTVPIQNITAFSSGNLGIGGQTLALPVLPAREFIREEVPPESPASFFEITGILGHSGKDESQRKFGISELYYGGEALIAPFGRMLGDDFALALGAGVFTENSRLRIPVMAHIRYTFFGSPHVEEHSNFLPNDCTFRLPGDAPLPEPAGYTEIPGGERDSTVHLLHEKTLVKESFRPFLFAEGGPIFDTDFEGSGADPSLNPDDYSEYFFGAGVGAPLFDILTISLGYRYMRLNLRTPCPACGDKSIVNINDSHSILLKLGLRFEY